MTTPEEDRLRAQVAELEARLAAAEGAGQETGPGPGSWWRSVGAALLILLACLLAPLSVTSVWASTVLSDTDRYVETVAPLADEAAVRDAVADDVTAVILDNLRVEEITNDVLAAIGDRPNVPPRVSAALPALAIPLTNGIESFTRDQVDKVLASDQFATVWAEVNRVAHEQVVRLLEGDEAGVVTAQDDTITLNLGPVIELVKEQLVEQGFSLAERIPAIDRTFVLVQSEGITRAQGFYSALNLLGAWLPVIALAVLAAGVLLARDRRRALLRGALGVVGAMAVLGIGLALARFWYVGATPAGILTEDAAGNVFDTLVRFLRSGLRATAVLGLVVALGAFLSGRSPAATRTRAAFQGGAGSLRGSAEAAGWHTGRVGAWTFAHKRSLRVATLITAGLVLMFWDQPSAWVVAVTALLVLLVLFALEFLAAPPAQAVVDRGSQS